jgi:hypothetical protein
MPLLDHFHPPLYPRRHWEGFFVSWSSVIASSLNQSLPPGYFAEIRSSHEPRIEPDVRTWRDSPAHNLKLVQLRQADLRLPVTTFPPEFGIHVYDEVGGITLVAAIELVSPGNKDRIETRKAFTAKCANNIMRAVGLIVIDTVTSEHSRPFEELMAFQFPGRPFPDLGPLTAVSYRPDRDKDGNDFLEIRHHSLAVGKPLPDEIPMAIGGQGHVVLNLEAIYEEARERSRL